MSKSNSIGTKLIVDGVQVGGLNTINGIKITAETIDVTDFDNESGYRSKMPGFKDTENPTAGGFLDGDNSGQDKCIELMDSGETVPIEIRFPAKIGKSWKFNGSVVSFATSAEVANAIGFDVEFAVDGKPTLAATTPDTPGAGG